MLELLRFDEDRLAERLAETEAQLSARATGIYVVGQGPRRVDVTVAPVIDQPGWQLLTIHDIGGAEAMRETQVSGEDSMLRAPEVLAHEIKNPLSGIRGAAQLLEPGLKDEDRALTQLICAETDRIRNLVDRMEVFGDERPIVAEPVNIHVVLDHVKRLAETGFGDAAKISVEFDPSLPPVPGDRDKLVQAFLNLVKNAAEAIQDTREKGRIILRTAFRPGMRLAVPGTGARISLPLMIEVEDTGPGVAEDMKPHLFDPFVTSKRQGSGLGLALVAKIIRDHGGVIECESVPKRTVFRVLLPMQDGKGKRGN